jgi:hypothetical protein
MTRPSRGAFWQVPARRSHRRVGALNDTIGEKIVGPPTEERDWGGGVGFACRVISFT